MTPEEVIAEVKESALRGCVVVLASPPVFKWSFMPRQFPGQKYPVRNPTKASPAPARTATSSQRYNPHIGHRGYGHRRVCDGHGVGYNYIHGETFPSLRASEEALE